MSSEYRSARRGRHRYRSRRFVSSIVGALVILLIGLWLPVSILAPLPATKAVAVEPHAEKAPKPTLPAVGASAATLGPTGDPIGTSGSTKPVRMAGAVKLIAVMVVLDEKPIEGDQTGPDITMTAKDQTLSEQYAAWGYRAVPVTAGDKWSEREVINGVVAGGGTNLAITLVNWAFASQDDYLEAASRWITEHKFDDTNVLDTTAESKKDQGTATDMARLTALALENPVVAHALAADNVVVHGQTVTNVQQLLPDLGVTAVSTGATSAGWSTLFRVNIKVREGVIPIYAAFTGMRTLDDVKAAVTDFVAHSAETVRPGPGLPADTVIARYNTPWGQRVDATNTTALGTAGWPGTRPRGRLSLTPQAPASAGTVVGTIRIDGEGTTLSAVELKDDIRDPGIGWRLTHPIDMWASFIAEVQHQSDRFRSTH